jgi:hypothetical protein
LDSTYEVGISEFQMNKYFTYIEKNTFLTFINYKQIRHPPDVEFKLGFTTVNHLDQYYLINEAVKIQIPQGYYLNFENFKQALYIAVDRVYATGNQLQSFDENRRKIPADPVRFMNAGQYYDHMFTNGDEEFYFGRNQSGKSANNLVQRMKFIDEQIIFNFTDCGNCDNSHIDRIIMGEKLASNIGVSNDSIIDYNQSRISIKQPIRHILNQININCNLIQKGNTVKIFIPREEKIFSFMPLEKDYFKCEKSTLGRVYYKINTEFEIKALFQVKLNFRPLVQFFE